MTRKRKPQDKVRHAQYTRKSRAKAREKGGLIVYALITSPEAIKAWHALKETFGNNRDVVENALIDCHEQLEQP